MNPRRRCAWLAGSLALTLAAAAQTAPREHFLPETHSNYIHALEDPKRVTWQQPDQVIEKLDLKPGMAVADLGAGSGYFTMKLADAVGPKGVVYAIDIDQGMLDYISQRMKADKETNIKLVLAAPHDPKLANASVDLIFICDTLHHIPERPTYYPLLMRALRPGGRLVNIDFLKKPLPLGPPPAQKIDKDDMIAEAKAGGFRLIKEFDFLQYQYFLIFGR